MVLNIFTAKSGSFSYTKLENKVEESNQASASFNKPWLATDEANRSPVV